MPDQHISAQHNSIKISHKSLPEQIDVVAEFHAHNIASQRIAYRTGIDYTLVQALIEGKIHQSMFATALAKHRQRRRDQRLKQSRRLKGIAQAELQEKIIDEYQQTLAPAAKKKAKAFIERKW